jgi:hypothetical protein
MTFTDAQVVIANLVSITTDFDESRHVVYDNVEWSAVPLPTGCSDVWYAAGEDLTSCVDSDPRAKSARTVSENPT